MFLVSCTQGFSCKNLSKLFNNRAEFRDCVATKTGSSGTTARSTAGHVATHQPPIVILENVADLLDPVNKLNVTALVDELRAGGYKAKAMVMDAASNGFPISRPRCYFVALNLQRCGLTDEQCSAILHNMFDLMKSMDVSGKEFALEALVSVLPCAFGNNNKLRRPQSSPRQGAGEQEITKYKKVKTMSNIFRG